MYISLRDFIYFALMHLFPKAGGNGPFMSPLPTKLLMYWKDITTDHRDVPAFEMNLHGDQQVFGWPFGFLFQAVGLHLQTNIFFHDFGA